jgi:ABC-type branched-subunit amino acid transport system ATPase component/ABC-type branched-subunit amino acid transport system permease subunit
MEYIFQIGIFVAIFAILAGSYNLLIGYSGLFSLAHAAFFGLGAYGTALLTSPESDLVSTPWPIWLGMLVAVVFTALTGLIIAVPALRVSADYLVVLSFGFQMVVVGVFLNWIQITKGESGITGVQRPTLLGMELNSSGTFLIYAILLTLLVYYLLWRVTGTPYGRMLKAIRDDQIAAESLGKRVVRSKIEIFCYASGIAGLAGAMFAQYVRVVSPASFLLDVSVEILAMLILGGTANILGSLVGAAVLTVLPELLRFLDVGSGHSEQVRLIVFGALLILILRFRPEGLLPEYWRPAWLRRRQERAVADDLAELRQGPLVLPPEVLGTTAKTGRPAIMMEVEDAVRSFGGIRALNGFSTTLETGRITALIGPNGAGKTTAFNLITGFLAPDSGRILLAGLDITNTKPHLLAGLGVARSFQNLRLFYQMTVLDNVMVGIPGQKGERLAWATVAMGPTWKEERQTRRMALQILRYVGLEERALTLAENLSYAEEKLLVLARMLAMQADLLLLDEPASGLDPNSLDAMYAMIRQLAEGGKTICIIEHNLDVIKELAHKIVFLDEGRAFAEGSTESLLKNPELAARYFGNA